MIFGPGRERTPENFSEYESDQLSFFCGKEEGKHTLEEIQEAVKEITVKQHKRKINKAGIREDKLKDFGIYTCKAFGSRRLSEYI